MERRRQEFIFLGVTIILPGHVGHDGDKNLRGILLTGLFILCKPSLSQGHAFIFCLICKGQSLSYKKSGIPLLFFVPVFSFRNRFTGPCFPLGNKAVTSGWPGNWAYHFRSLVACTKVTDASSLSCSIRVVAFDAVLASAHTAINNRAPCHLPWSKWLYVMTQYWASWMTDP